MKIVKNIFIVIFLLIPTILAIWLYQNAQKRPVIAKAVQKIEFVDLDGKTSTYVKEKSEDADVIKFLVNMNDTAEEVKELPADIAATPHFTATFFSYDKKSVYEYYVSKDPDKGFLVGPDKNAYKIDTETASAFACNKFAASLYSGSHNPVLFIGAEAVLPTDYEWKYQLANGEYRKVTVKTTTEVLSYAMSASLAMKFDVVPDIFNVTVMEGTDIIFEGEYKDIVNLQITESKTLRFHAEAKWYELEGKEGQGLATYDFTTTVNQPASFYLSQAGSDPLVPGDFVMITVKNAAASNAISVTSAPDIGYTPVFTADGSYFRALVPLNYSLNPGSYVLTCTCDGISQDLKITVGEKTFKKQNYAVSQDIINATRSSAALTEFKDTMKPIASSLAVESGRLFSGVFGEGVPDTALLKTGIGITRVINGGESYRHDGVDYSVDVGSPITAVNAGKVIYVGDLALSGKTIVIEHGFGLKSWYCHLSSANVTVGQSVNGGDQIGASGSSGFCTEGWAHIGLSVYDIPVSPYRLWENELAVPTP